MPDPWFEQYEADMATALTLGQIDLLLWLSKEDLSQYGECHGSAFDGLQALGIVELLGEETETHNPFIAKGRGKMFRAVRLTDKGKRFVASIRGAMER